MSAEIILSDCMNYMKSVPDCTFNTIITSPPYNKGHKKNGASVWNQSIDYDIYMDDMDDNEYVEWQKSFLNECYRVLRDDGSMFYNHKCIRKNNQSYFPDFVFSTNFKLYQLIYWNRQGFVDFNDSYLHPTTELIFWLCKGKPKVFTKSGLLFKDEVWNIRPTKSINHPASFPVELPYNCILLTTEPGDLVYDPFVGSGTTGVAANMLNREFIGNDISQFYVDVANKSISNCGEVKMINNKATKKLF